MCGRYTLAPGADELVEAFDLPALTFDFVPRYNIAPGQSAPIVAQDSRGRRTGLLHWGFVPEWAGERAKPLINARAESVATKASFREAFERRRCLVPADGFYEWARADGSKRPYWFSPVASGLLALGGIWETWTPPGATPRHAFAILTTEANDDVRAVHDRMPVLVERERYSDWLARGTARRRLESMMRPAAIGTLEVRPVSDRVNRTDADDAGLIEATGL